MKPILAICLYFISWGSPLLAAAMYTVELDTTALLGHIAGPFSLAVQLAPGSGADDGNNIVVLSDFSLGGGSVLDDPIALGGVTGDLNTVVRLTDTNAINFFSQKMVIGNHLSFTGSLTTNMDAGGVADLLLIYVLDATGTPIPTLAGEFIDAVTIFSIDGPAPTVQTFAGDASRAPAGGSPGVMIPAPVTTAVPEPITSPGVAFVFFLSIALSHLRCRRHLDGCRTLPPSCVMTQGNSPLDRHGPQVSRLPGR
jgi:hypothetical protein